MVPLSYSYRNLRVRWKTTLMTASGFVLVVGAIVVMLAFVSGVETVCTTSGEPDNVIALGQGGGDESFLKLETDQARQIENSVRASRYGGKDAPASRELLMFITYGAAGDGVEGMHQVRGVLPEAFEVHTKVRLVEGRMFRPGIGELIVGRAVARLQDLELGGRVSLGSRQWTVAGIFESGGATFESEIWCDLGELASQFRREGYYSSVVVRTHSAAAAQALTEELKINRSIDAKTEPEYYAKQAEQAVLMRNAAWVIAWIMGMGAVFGVMNSMFAAIGQRTKDIAVLRVLGFKAHEILIAFLVEAMLIAALGGTLGAALGYATNGVTRSGMMGYRRVEFAFQVDMSIMLTAGLLTLFLGILGGIVPALSAMRVKPLEALR